MKTELPKAECSQVWDNLGLGLLLTRDMAHCTNTTDNVLIRNEHVITHKFQLSCEASFIVFHASCLFVELPSKICKNNRPQ